MAKRKAKPAGKRRAGGRKTAGAKRSAKRPTRKAARKSAKARRKPTRDVLVVPTPPSSLNMNRRGSAARTGRREIAESLEKHKGMNELAGGDLDVDVEDAYFTGEESPGGDNPTPDQDVVDDIGRAVGVEYQDNEELDTTKKVTSRDKHRWELDPASAEDYKERK
jgi:uncharacterized protein DUF6335